MNSWWHGVHLGRGRGSTHPCFLYWVSIYWHKVDVTTGKASPESPLVYHPVEEIPAHVMKMVRKVQAVLAEKITQADRDRLAEDEAFKAKMLSWFQTA